MYSLCLLLAAFLFRYLSGPLHLIFLNARVVDAWFDLVVI